MTLGPNYKRKHTPTSAGELYLCCTLGAARDWMLVVDASASPASAPPSLVAMRGGAA